MNEKVVRKAGHIRLGSGDSPTGRCFEGLSVMSPFVVQFPPWVADWSVCHVNICNIVSILSGSPTPPIFHPGFDGLKLSETGHQKKPSFSSVSFVKNLVRAVR